MLLVAGTMSFVACGDDDDDKKDDQKPTSSLYFTYQEGINALSLSEQEVKSLITARGFQLTDTELEEDATVYEYMQQDADNNYIIAQYMTLDGKVTGFSCGIFTDDTTLVKNQFVNWCNQVNNYMKSNNYMLFDSPVDFYGCIEYITSEEPYYENFAQFMSVIDNLSLSEIFGAYADYETEYNSNSTSDTYRSVDSEFSMFNIDNVEEARFPSNMTPKKYGVGFDITDWGEVNIKGNNDWTKKKSLKLLAARH